MHQRISKQFKWLSFIACVGVVVIHSRSYLTLPNPGMLVKCEQYFIAESLVRFSVQSFFAISGFWWARKWNGGMFAGYGSLIAKKWRTLILPYLIWSVLGAFLSLALTGANNLGTHRPFFERSVFAIHGVWPFVDNLFGINKSGPLGDMPLWFLRQLILFFAITPLIALTLRQTALAFVLGFGLIFFGRLLPSPPFVFIFPGWLGWFMLGAAISRTDFVEHPYSKTTAISSGIIWIVASVISTIHQVGVLKYCARVQDIVAVVIALSGMVFLVGDVVCSREARSSRCCRESLLHLRLPPVPSPSGNLHNAFCVWEGTG